MPGGRALAMTPLLRRPSSAKGHARPPDRAHRAAPAQRRRPVLARPHCDLGLYERLYLAALGPTYAVVADAVQGSPRLTGRGGTV